MVNNYEWIRTQTPAELAEWMCENMRCNDCPGEEYGCTGRAAGLKKWMVDETSKFPGSIATTTPLESIDRIDEIIIEQNNILAEVSASISNMSRRIKEHRTRLNTAERS